MLSSASNTVRSTAAVLLTVAVVAGTVFAVSALERSAADNGYRRTLVAQNLLTAMLDRETGLRGFVYAGKESFLDPYRSGSAHFAAAVNAARRDVREVPSAKALLAAQLDFARLWQVTAEKAIAQVRRVGVRPPTVAQALARKRLMDSFRAANARYLATMNQWRISDLAAASELSTWIVAALSLLLALGGLLLVRVGARREERRRAIVAAAERERELHHLAMAEHRARTDWLTGLPNRRALSETFKRMLAQAGRSAAPLSVMLLDLDHFKQINDSHGHQCGDEVLASVGALLEETVRSSDFAARLGGEEFVVLLPATEPAGAQAVASSIAAALAGARVSRLERPITASFGISDFPQHGVDADTLMRSADHALYRAKQDGRNCIRVAADMPSGRERRASAGMLRARVEPAEQA